MADKLLVRESFNNATRYVNIQSGSVDMSLLLPPNVTIDAGMYEHVEQMRSKAMRLLRRAEIVEEAMGEISPPTDKQRTTKAAATGLLRYLEEQNTSVHWVYAHSPLGIEQPTVAWPQEPRLTFSMALGTSEGFVVRVSHKPDLYNHRDLRPLLAIKFLAGHNKALQETGLAMTFLEKWAPGD